MKRILRRSLLCIMHCALCILLCGCYNRGPITPDASNLTEQQLDSISFYTTHHYTQNYNFVVTGDSLVVVAQQPEAMAIPDVVSIEIESIGEEQQKDSITLRKYEHIVVADIMTVPSDTIDSVWVKVARILGLLRGYRGSLWRSPSDATGSQDRAFQRYPLVLSDNPLSVGGLLSRSL